MNLERIKKLLKQKENLRLEFKEARTGLTDNLFDTIPGLNWMTGRFS